MTAPPAASGAEVTQAALEGVAGVAAEQAGRAFATLDVARLTESLPRFSAVIAGVVRKYGSGASTLAVHQYQQERRRAGILTKFTARPAGSVPLQQAGSMVSWATQPLWAEQPAVDAATANLIAGVEKLVLDQARDTIIDNARRDPKAHGWVRVPEPDACSFCMLLATRGAVYKSSTASFRSHDNCRCHAAPTFGPYEPSASVRSAQQIYADLPHGSPKHLRRAFRAAWENRAAPAHQQ